MDLELSQSDYEQDLAFSANIWSLREILPAH